MEQIAEVYSRALFDASVEHDVLDRVHDEIDQFADELSSNRDLQVLSLIHISEPTRPY